jgi:succinate-semialdehyde dehydrogenase/glutarate-semialdehyde dehydrogenase
VVDKSSPEEQDMAASTMIDPATRTYQTVNPATGELVREFPMASAAEAEAMLSRAHAAYVEWRDVPLSERIRLFRRYADVVEANLDELARLTTLEMGKPLAQSLGESGLVPQMYRYFADHAESLLQDEELTIEGFSRVILRREPVGVVLGIEPWNAPLFQASRATAPNLILGNTVLLKPSELCAGSTLLFDELFRQAGFPADVYQTVLISTAQASTYIADPRVRAVTLTGSDRAGAAVAEQTGRNIKPVVLELGGSDAFVVLDSADVAKAAGTASFCRIIIGGQACALPKRIIVTERVADEFISAFTAAFTNQTMGDPFDPATTLGPLSSQAAVELLQSQLDDAVSKGATVLAEGGRVDGAGSFFKPVVLTGVTPGMRLYTEEAFGPLAVIYQVPDANAAVELANDNPYGLGGAVFGEDLAEAQRVASRLDTGGVGVNAFLGAPVEMPFGGTKRSGFGRELGRAGLDAFANLKAYGMA